MVGHFDFKLEMYKIIIDWQIIIITSDIEFNSDCYRASDSIIFLAFEYWFLIALVFLNEFMSCMFSESTHLFSLH